MRTIFENNPNENLVDRSVISDVKQKVFKIEKISLVKVIDRYSCDLVAEDSKGVRSYRVQLERNSRFPHLYKVKEVKGQKITSDYQWRKL